MISILPWQDQPLRELLARRDKMPHALLIHGRPGIGKVEFARAIAQSLLCEANQDGIACGQCAACGWFREGNHPDFRALFPDIFTEAGSDPEATLDAAEGNGDKKDDKKDDRKDEKKSKEIRIDQIRALGGFMALSTHRDGFRVLLIYPAETLNPNAANSLLKTLEEPPPRTLILLVTDQPNRLLATLRSRCQRVLLAAPPSDQALAWLTGQGVANPQQALAMAGGAPLDALDFSTPEYQSERKSFVAALADPAADYMAAAQGFEKADLNHILTWLQTWVADIALSRLAGEVRHHLDQEKAIAAIATRVQLPKLFRYESELRQSRRSISHPLNARLLLEQLLISYQRAIQPASRDAT
jgi:DNA polymerase-3 subunit delta'